MGYKDFITFQLTLAGKRPPSMLSELPMAKRLPMNDSRRAVKTELQPVSHRPLSAGTVVFRQILLGLASVSVGLRSLAEAADALDLGQFRGGFWSISHLVFARNFVDDGCMKTQAQLDSILRAARGPHAIEEMIRETKTTQVYVLSNGKKLTIDKRTGVVTS